MVEVGQEAKWLLREPPRELAIRIPASIKGCFQMGLDVQACSFLTDDWRIRWSYGLHEGIVDVVIGQTFSSPELLDAMTDFRPLIEAVKGTPCRIHAALHSLMDSDRLSEATIEMIRAAACNYWSQGVDGLYLAHWFGNWPYQASFYEKLRELPHPDVMAKKDKYYYVPTETGRYPKPVTEPGITMTLPAALELNKPTTVQFRISEDLPRWDKVGRISYKILNF